MTTQRESVLAVLLTEPHNAYLGETLSALANQTLAPTRLILALRGHDASIDRVVEQAQCPFPIEIEYVAVSTTLSQAVEHLGGGDEPWLWLLHGDSAPSPRCLDELLRTGEVSEKIGAVGPKQVRWSDQRLLLEMGITATRFARRVPEIPEGEYDQGQLDGRADVLGVSSAAMLIRRQACTAIGGLDPVLGPFGDGLETSRRLWLGGWRVVIQPKAVIRHAQASFDGVERRSFGRRRGAQIYNALAAAPAILWILALLGYVLLGPLRAALRLCVKEPRLARGEISGALWPLAHMGALIGARRRIKTAKRVPASVLRSLEAPGGAVRRGRREMRRVRTEIGQMEHMPGPIELRERFLWQSKTFNWFITSLVIATLVSLVANLPLLGKGVLSGGAVAGDVWTTNELVSAATSWWLPSGLGQSGQIDALWILLIPFVAVSELFGGNLGWVATGLILTGIPLSAMSAFFLGGRLTNSPHMRFIGALLWGFAPPLLSAVTVGQVGGIVWHVTFPLVVAGVITYWRKGSSASLGLASLAAMFACASAPATLVLIASMSVVGLIVRRRIGWLWLSIPAFAVLIPLIREVGLSPALFGTVGVSVQSNPSWLSLLAFNPGPTDPSFIALVAVACIAFAALITLLKARNWGVIRFGWLLIPIGFTWARLCTQVTTGTVFDGAAVVSTAAWAGVGLSLAFSGMWVAVIAGGDGLRTWLSQYSFGLRHLVVLGGIGLTVIASGTLGGTWAYSSLRDGEPVLHSAHNDQVPALARSAQVSPDRSRALMLVPTDDGVRASVLRNPGKQLHESSLVSQYRSSTPDEADAAVISAVSGLINGDDVSNALAQLATGIVVVPVSDTDISESARMSLVDALDSSVSLAFVTENDSSAFWRVKSPDPFARVVASDGSEEAVSSGIFAAHGTIPASFDGGTLLLAERSDTGWIATLDGRELAGSQDSWNQQWELPEGGGSLTISRPGYERWFAYLQLGILIATCVLALPIRSRKQVRE